MSFKKYGSSLLLLLTAMIWGSTFVAQKYGLNYIGPFTFNACRFTIGALCVLIFSLVLDRAKVAKGLPTEHPYLMEKKPNKTLFIAGILCGVSLFLASSLQQVGLQYTDAGKCAFVTALYMAIVPILGLFIKRKAGINAWAGVVIATAGFYFLCILPGKISLNLGDLLALAGSLFWALQILFIDHYVNKTDGIKIAALQFIVTAILSIIAAVATEDIVISAIPSAGIPILYSGFLAVGLAFTLQIIGQKNTPPVLASLILSLESVFAVIGSSIMLHEAMTGRESLGCALIFAGVILAQIPVQNLLVRKKAQ